MLLISMTKQEENSQIYLTQLLVFYDLVNICYNNTGLMYDRS